LAVWVFDGLLREDWDDDVGMEENRAADYRFRASCSDGTLTDFVAVTVPDLDYDNFKNRGRRRGAGRGTTCSLGSGA